MLARPARRTAAVGSALAVAGAALALAASASAETLYVDSRSSDNLPGGQGPIASTTVLTAGQTYKMTVTGTFSVWVKWYAFRCGRPDPAPMFTSPSQVFDTPAGWDAEFIFAKPARTRAVCRTAVIPQHRGEFRINLGDGKWVHPVPNAGVPSAPHANHIYHYRIVGQGQPVRFRIQDHHWQDNNGRLKVDLVPVGAPAPVAPVPELAPVPDPVPAV